MKSEEGVTLIELLAALTLLSIIILLASSVNIIGQKQATTQNTEIQGQTNVRLGLNIITKEIRSAESVSAINNILTIKKNNEEVKYFLDTDNHILKKNGEPLISNIKKFKIEQTTDNITISISSNNTPSTTLETTLYFRK